ncbi:MAG: hypothetical protein V1748_11835 [Actinomycetota bacterium]
MIPLLVLAIPLVLGILLGWFQGRREAVETLGVIIVVGVLLVSNALGWSILKEKGHVFRPVSRLHDRVGLVASALLLLILAPIGVVLYVAGPIVLVVALLLPVRTDGCAAGVKDLNHSN